MNRAVEVKGWHWGRVVARGPKERPDQARQGALGESGVGAWAQQWELAGMQVPSPRKESDMGRGAGHGVKAELR